MKKRNSKDQHPSRNDLTSDGLNEGLGSADEVNETDSDLTKQIIAKATGVEPYESDKIKVDASLRNSTTKPHMVGSMEETEELDVPPENLTSRSPPFLSGGGGFDYEDYVVAYHLAMMLLQRMPLGGDLVRSSESCGRQRILAGTSLMTWS